METGILDEKTTPAVLMTARENYMRQCFRGEPSAAATFSYAHAMIGSRKKADIKEGIVCLEKLLHDEEDTTSKWNYVFYMSVAQARIKNYDSALKLCEVLLNLEPNNVQAQKLEKEIMSNMQRDGLIGAAIVGGGALALVGLAALISFVRK